MNTMTKIGSALSLASLLALAGCNTMQPAYSDSSYPQSNQGSGAYVGYGVVQSIEVVRQDNSGIGGSGVGAGTILGAVVGGIVGNQVGGGSGKTAATVLGAAGGAYAGNQIEKRNQNPSEAYRFTIRMNNGSYQTVTQTSIDDIRIGDRVRIENGVARRY
jgi:outer membrane lipoprotein SlyB